ncbi:unnamed protein product, partial [Symbiodinium microadriaticum]
MKLFYLSGREVWQRVEHPWLHWKSVEYKAGWTSGKGASLEEKQARKEAKQEAREKKMHGPNATNSASETRAAPHQAKRRKKEKENTKKKEARAKLKQEKKNSQEDATKLAELRHNDTARKREYRRKAKAKAAAAKKENEAREALRGELDVLYKRAELDYAAAALEEADGKVSTDEVGFLKHRASEWGDIAARAEETVGIHK